MSSVTVPQTPGVTVLAEGLAVSRTEIHRSVPALFETPEMYRTFFLLSCSSIDAPA